MAGPGLPGTVARARYTLDSGRVDSAHAPWAPLIDDIIRQRYPDPGDPAAHALRLAWTRSLAASTYRTYAAKFRKFLHFCATRGLVPVPAAPTTLELFVGHLMAEGKVGAASFPQYISAIRAVHRDLLLPYPDSPVLTLLLRGAQHLQRASALREESWPLPASAALSALTLATTSPDPGVVRACLAVGLGFACMMRGSSVQGLAADGASPHAATLQVAEVVRKGHTHSDPVARSLSIDCTRLPTLLLALSRWQQLQQGLFQQSTSPPTHLFQLPGEDLSRGDHFAAWFALCTSSVALVAPAGRRLHPHCTRRGAASAAHALGVSMASICHLGGWAMGSQAVWRYIDPLLQASPAGFQFFGHLLPPHVHHLWAAAGAP